MNLCLTPFDADLVLEVSINVAPLGKDLYYPKFRVAMSDPKTNVLIWTIAEPGEWAWPAKTVRNNVARAMAKLVDDLRKLAPTP